MDYKKNRVITKIDGAVSENVPQAPLLNWAAPCELKAKLSAVPNLNLDVELARAHEKGVAAVVGPQFAYAKGELVLGEKKDGRLPVSGPS